MPLRQLLLLLQCACLTLVATTTAQQQCQNSINDSRLYQKPPMVVPKMWLPNSVTWNDALHADVHSYSALDNSQDDQNAVCTSLGNKVDLSTLVLQKVVIGRMPQFDTEQALHVLDAAVDAWKGGAGVWTAQYTTQQRIAAIRNVLVELKKVREEIVTILQWEIGKNRVDAESEFDRTVQFAELLMETMTNRASEFMGRWEPVAGSSGVTALTKRAAIGIILALAPYNYPINESYATILPALLTGNIVIVKIPTVGGLAHLLTMEALQKALPAGTIHFISGRGRATMPPLMASGKIDGLAFIGGHDAADALIKAHPHPHRLHTFLQLEAKNMAIVLPDVFEAKTTTATSVLDNTIAEVVLGSLSFNGQRCTALKLIFVPQRHADAFVEALTERIESLNVGLPWQRHSFTNNEHSQITPLPNPERIAYMQSLLDDAVSKGSKIMNRDGGTIVGGPDSTLMVPAVVYPVTPDMRLYTEEQFGPIVPVAPYDDLETVLDYGQTGRYAQQVSIFGHNSDTVARIVDRFGAVFGKVNLNSQCGRSPDTLPFSGRRSSAMGVMSVYDALVEFSVPTVLAYRNSMPLNVDLAEALQEKSIFLGATAAAATQ